MYLLEFKNKKCMQKNLKKKKKKKRRKKHKQNKKQCYYGGKGNYGEGKKTLVKEMNYKGTNDKIYERLFL